MSSAFIKARPAYTIEENQLKDVVLMTVEGFFDMPSLHDHFAENASVVKRWRTAGRPIRVFINAVDLRPHRPEGQACVQDATTGIYRPGDRVGILVSSSLVKMQMRRALSRDDILNFFDCKDAALEWLNIKQ